MKKKTITASEEKFNNIKLGVQPKPSDYRIFKGSPSEFFKKAAEDFDKGSQL